MYSTILIGIISLLIQSTSGAPDSGIIIGSSVGGVLGLVSGDLKKKGLIHLLMKILK